MNEQELQALRAENAERRKRKEAATAGPWRSRPNASKPYNGWIETIVDPSSMPAMYAEICSKRPGEDAAFIAAARADPVEDRIDALLAEVSDLQQEILFINRHRRD